jgi:hypothetical protein
MNMSPIAGAARVFAQTFIGKKMRTINISGACCFGSRLCGSLNRVAQPRSCP